MHEPSMEELGETVGQIAVCGRVSRAEACHTVAEVGEQHGQSVAHPGGHSPGKHAQANEAKADVGCVRKHVSGHRRAESQASEGGSLAGVGEPAHSDTETIRPRRQPILETGTPVTTTAVLGLLNEQSYRCALTGRALTPETAALDHIVPIQRGGKHALENTQVLHNDVNRAKGTMTNEEFVAMCGDVVRWRAGAEV